MGNVDTFIVANEGRGIPVFLAISCFWTISDQQETELFQNIRMIVLVFGSFNTFTTIIHTEGG